MPSIKKNISALWIGRFWQKSRLLCSITILFFCCSVFANLLQLETSPFFIWDMYKNPVRDKMDYDVYLIGYNNNGILNFKNTWKEPQKIYLTSPLFYYMEYKENNSIENSRKYMEDVWAAKHPAFKWLLPYLNNSAEQFAAFPDWYKKYLSSILHQEINNIDIIKTHVQFMDDQSLKTMSSDTIHLIP
ncbi:MAG: hypothetical protein ABJA78_05380 [Ferruginibacter sp.]